MKEWQDQAIILQVGLFHEADIWLRMLCQNAGLQTVFAFGGAKSIHRFCGCLDVFNILECHIKSSREDKYLLLQEASLLKAPRVLRKDWRKMGIAINCLRFLDCFGVNGESSGECFNIIQNLYFILESGRRISALLPLFFRLRIATTLGFAPDFGHCSKCGKIILDNSVFSPVEGVLFCQNCAQEMQNQQKRNSISLTHKDAMTLKAIQMTLPEQWPVETDAKIKPCAQIIDSFVYFQLGLEWRGGKFRHI